MAFRTFQKTGDAHPGMIRVRWCPGHTGIEGNELADQLAKEGAKLPVGNSLPTVSYCKRHMRRLLLWLSSGGGRQLIVKVITDFI